MQMDQAARLRERWEQMKQRGDTVCEHPDFEQEYYLGMSSGEYICTTCGSSFTWQEMQTIIDQRQIIQRQREQRQREQREAAQAEAAPQETAPAEMAQGKSAAQE